jgi:hypothetical protein
MYFDKEWDRYYEPDEESDEENPCYPGYQLTLNRENRVYLEGDEDFVFRGVDRFKHFSDNIKKFLLLIEEVSQRKHYYKKTIKKL